MSTSTAPSIRIPPSSPITIHIVFSETNYPLANIPCTLRASNPSSPSEGFYQATTDLSGWIRHWDLYAPQGCVAVEDVQERVNRYGIQQPRGWVWHVNLKLPSQELRTTSTGLDIGFWVRAGEAVGVVVHVGRNGYNVLVG